MRGWALVEMRGLGLGRCRRCTMYALLNELLITTIDILESNIIYIEEKISNIFALYFRAK